MLGEIFGRNAGDTTTELILTLFLLLRGASIGVFLRFGVPAIFGIIWGLPLFGANRGEGLGNIGDGRGWRAENFAVSTSCGALGLICVTSCDNRGLGKLADSGSSKFSMCSEATCPGWVVSEDLPFGDILNKVAGVAGDAMPLSDAGSGWMAV